MKKLVPKLVAFAFLMLILFLLSRTLVKKETQLQKIPQKTSESIKDDPIILAAGDIGQCTGENSAATATANLLDSPPGTILTLGDNAYPDGSKEDFETCFEPTWGKYKKRIFPSVGDHEYRTKDAKSYYEYFGEKAGEPGKGYYSFNLGSWHLIAVNTYFMTTTQIGDNYKKNLEQMEWLKKDLEQNKTDCTLIYGHRPRFSSTVHGASEVAPLWELAYSENVDVILAGDAHEYERFSPQTPEGKLDVKRGIRQFIVGTGGAELIGHGRISKNTEVINAREHGILKLVLGKGEYEWEFISTSGIFTDKGKSACH